MKDYNKQQISEITAYARANFRLEDAISHHRYEPSPQRLFKECVENLRSSGISQEEADAYIASRRWFKRDGLLVDLDEPEAPSEEQLKTYYALYVAAERIGANNYRNGLYRPRKSRKSKPIPYSITKEHQAIIDAMSEVLSGLMSPEAAMALLNEYDVQKQQGVLTK